MSGVATIWKFPLQTQDVQRVPMPAGAKVLFVAMQDEVITLWAHVDPTAPLIDRLLAVVGTGNPCPTLDEANYLGSVLDRIFVWHVFEATDG